MFFFFLYTICHCLLEFDLVCFIETESQSLQTPKTNSDFIPYMVTFYKKKIIKKIGTIDMKKLESTGFYQISNWNQQDFNEI